MTSQEPNGSSRSLLITLLRMALGIVFIYASIGKIADPEAFASSIGNYRLLAPFPALTVATVLPWIELLSGFGLLMGLFGRGSSLLVSIMLIVFTALVISAMARGLDISCGCFTADPAVDKVGWRKVAENLTLLAISLVVFRSADRGHSLDHVFRRGQPSAPLESTDKNAGA